jgi:hypothetical protein
MYALRINFVFTDFCSKERRFVICYAPLRFGYRNNDNGVQPFITARKKHRKLWRDRQTIDELHFRRWLSLLGIFSFQSHYYILHNKTYSTPIPPCNKRTVARSSFLHALWRYQPSSTSQYSLPSPSNPSIQPLMHPSPPFPPVICSTQHRSTCAIPLTA